MRPEFFRDKLMGRLGSRVVIVYQALWVFADDGGVARIEPDVLKGEAFVRWPEYTHGVILDCLVTLHGAKRLRPYVVGDELYGELPKLRIHSPINRPSQFRHPRDGQEITDIRAWLSGQVTHSVLSEHSSPVLPLPSAFAVTENLKTRASDDDVVSDAEQQLFEHLPPESHEALNGILRAAQSRRPHVAAAIRGIAPGGVNAGTDRYSWPEVGQALLDTIASSDARFEPRRFRVFCRKIREDAQGRGPGGSALTPAEVMIEAAKAKGAA